MVPYKWMLLIIIYVIVVSRHMYWTGGWSIPFSCNFWSSVSEIGTVDTELSSIEFDNFAKKNYIFIVFLDSVRFEPTNSIPIIEYYSYYHMVIWYSLWVIISIIFRRHLGAWYTRSSGREFTDIKYYILRVVPIDFDPI